MNFTIKTNPLSHYEDSIQRIFGKSLKELNEIAMNNPQVIETPTVDVVASIDLVTPVDLVIDNL